MPKKLLYQEIIDYLKTKIINREFLPGDLLPSEFELTRDFKVSRITAQKALDELENSGLIYRVRGKGVSSATSPRLCRAIRRNNH